MSAREREREMEKSISEVGVEDLVAAGLPLGEAKNWERELKDAAAANCGLGAKEVWAEIMGRNLLKPWHPHTLHQLIFYSVYRTYDESVHGPPLYWFPSL